MGDSTDPSRVVGSRHRRAAPGAGRPAFRGRRLPAGAPFPDGGLGTSPRAAPATAQVRSFAALELNRRASAHAEAAIARDELVITRQRLVIDALARAGTSTAQALELLDDMERHLAALNAWRQRLADERTEA
jgi:hypothetical protein